MASVPDVVGLLYRADWTRLSLTAEVNTGIDPGLSWKSTQAATPSWQAAMPSWLHRDTPEPERLDGFRSRPRCSPVSSLMCAGWSSRAGGTPCTSSPRRGRVCTT